MIKILSQEISFEDSLRKRLEFICQFNKVKPTFINGSIRKIDKSNLHFVELHRDIIKGITFLVFYYSNDIYIGNLTNKNLLKTIMTNIEILWVKEKIFGKGITEQKQKKNKLKYLLK